MNCNCMLLVLTLLWVGSNAKQSHQCTLYLAESSIVDAGWGVFAGKDFEFGDRLEHPGIGIPVIDSHRLQAETVLLQYLWSSSDTGAFHEADHVSNFLPGIGSLANYHAFLQNVVVGGFTYDATTVGSSTAYHNFSFVASTAIKAGDELFVGPIHMDRQSYPTSEDYIRAQELVDGLVELREKHPRWTDIQWIDILYRLQHEMLPSQSDQRLKELLPQTLSDLLLAKEKGAAKYQLRDRDLEWVEQHGYCLDNIRQGPSSVHNAARGAFATRSIPKGSLIAPAPLIVVNASAFNLEHRGPDNQTVQLLGNYCFGTHASKDQFLLCPLSQIVLMNHRPVKPNAGIRWGKPSGNRKDANINLLLKSGSEIQDLYKEAGTKVNAPLMFDIYAINDINEGDEIFLDYTLQWSDAFAEYSNIEEERMPPISKDLSVVPNKGILPLSEDLHSSLSYLCRIEPFVRDKPRRIVEEEDYRGRPYHYFDRLDAHMRALFRGNDFLMWHPCDVVGTTDEGATFRAVVYSKAPTVQGVIRRYHNLPRQALRVIQGTYQSQQHHPKSFRHFLPIPDTHFPSRWRTDYVRNQDLRLGTPNYGIDMKKPGNVNHESLHEKKVREAKCGVYFAPSNIPEAGFSQYTAIPYVGAGITIGSTMPAIMIPRLYKNNHKWIIQDYSWAGKAYRAEYEVGKDKAVEVLGVSLANFHPGVLNMNLKLPKLHAVLDSCIDPGAGASSDYVGCSFISNRALSQGEELFISYGDAWFLSRNETFGDIAVSTNYDESNSLLASIWALSLTVFQKHEIDDVLSFTKKKLLKNPRTLSALKDIDDQKDLDRVFTKNGTALASMDFRSLEWLEKFGQCMDHIYVNKSTIHQAGHGAFARRFLAKGATIISSPMIHVWGRETMEMNISLIGVDIPVNPTMQLLNYQMSHPKSSLYLLPINQMVAINHNSARFAGGVAPNAKLQWASWNRKSHYSLQRPLEDLKKEPYSTMVMDVVAIRDIEPDEEVFIDYGLEWEIAWKEHLSNWRSPCQTGSRKLSMSAIIDMNNNKHNSSHHEWSIDHFVVCTRASNITDFETIYISNMSTSSWKGKLVTNDYEGINVEDEGFLYASYGNRRHPCKIRSRTDSPNFDAILFFSSFAIEIHRNMSQGSIEFIPKPYRSDMHLPGSFRHEMNIPDDIFPRHWMDLKDMTE